MALELDRVLQDLTRDFKKFRDSFGQAITGAQKQFIAAEATVKSIVQQAGGAAWTTFTGSIQIVGMQLSRFFIPGLISASKSLQDFGDWLEDLSPEQRKTLTQFSEMAIATAATAGVMRLLGLKVDATTIAFGLVIVAAQNLADWLDKKIGELDKKGTKAAGLQLTEAEVIATEEYQAYKRMSPEVRRKRLEDELKAQQRFVNETIPGTSEFNPLKNVGSKVEAREAALRRMALLTAIRRMLVFGETLPGTVPEYNPPGLGGGAGLGGLMGMLGVPEGLKNLFGSLGTAGRSRRPFRPDFPVELQPRFSSVEEARKQFQLQALKSPLEQDFIRIQREAAQEALDEKEKRNNMYDVLGTIKNWFGFR